MIKLRKGQRVRVTHKGSPSIPFEDYGKVGTFVSMIGTSSWYYIYIESSDNNNKFHCKDASGNAVTWRLQEKDFVVIDEQLLFSFMEE